MADRNSEALPPPPPFYLPNDGNAVESLGGWHKAAIDEIKKLGSALALHTGEDESITVSHLFQQLSIALMKGNASLLNIRNPCGAFDHDEVVGWG